MFDAFIDGRGISFFNNLGPSPFLTSSANCLRLSNLFNACSSLCNACTGMLLMAREKTPRTIIVPNRRDSLTLGCLLFIIPNSKLS
jgi:hypothetical protein